MRQLPRKGHPAVFPFVIVAALSLILIVPPALADSRGAELCLTVQQTPPLFQSGKGCALVIGVSKYRHLAGEKQLSYADDDARAFVDEYLKKRELTGLLFAQDKEEEKKADRVTLLVDEGATIDGIDKALDKFVQDSAGASIAYFYFAGHGDLVGNEGYLMAHDSRADSLRTALSTTQLLESLRRLACKDIVVIIDACRSGIFGDGAPHNPVALLARMGLSQRTIGRYCMITACQEGERAIELDELGHGVFTFHLLEALGEGASDPGALFAKVLLRVRDVAPGMNPTFAGSSASDFLLRIPPPSSGIRAGGTEANLDIAVGEGPPAIVYVDGECVGLCNFFVGRVTTRVSCGPHTVRVDFVDVLPSRLEDAGSCRVLRSFVRRDFKVFKNVTLDVRPEDSSRGSFVSRLARPCLLASLNYDGIAPEVASREGSALDRGRALLEEFLNLKKSGRTDLALLGKALEALADAESKAPRDPEVHVLLGRCCREAGDLRQAASHFEAALALGAKKPEVHLDLAGVLEAQGEWEIAATHLELYLDAEKSYQPAIARRAIDLYRRAGRPREALYLFQSALERAKAERDLAEQSALEEIAKPLKVFEEADAAAARAYEHSAAYRHEDALKEWEAALKGYRESGAMREVVVALLCLGDTEMSLGRFRERIKRYQEALSISEDLGDMSLQACAQYSIGRGFLGLSRYDEALGFFEIALAAFTMVGDGMGKGLAFWGIGMTYEGIGKYDEALKYYMDELATFRKEGDLRGEGGALCDIAWNLQHRGRPKEAIPYCERAFSIARKIDDPYLEGRALNAASSAYDKLGQVEKSLEYKGMALALERKVGDVEGEACMLLNIAMGYLSLGSYDKTLSYAAQALDMFREIGRLDAQGVAFETLGEANWQLCHYEKAIQNFDKALAISRGLKDPFREGEALYAKSSTFLDIGAFQDGLVLCRQALKTLRNTGEVRMGAYSKIEIARSYNNTGRQMEALENCRSALRTFHDIGDKKGEGLCLRMLGEIHARKGRYTEAEKSGRQALKILRDLKIKVGEADAMTSLGVTLTARGRLSEALGLFDKAIPVQRGSERRRELGLALEGKGRVLEKQGSAAKAVECLEEAVKVKESIRSELTRPEFIMAYNKAQEPAYERLINLLLRLGKKKEARDYLERSGSERLRKKLSGKVKQFP
jgi:tetratricopeptide (TPR) repeat protein